MLIDSFSKVKKSILEIFMDRRKKAEKEGKKKKKCPSHVYSVFS
jgi:hypothetical protein